MVEPLQVGDASVVSTLIRTTRTLYVLKRAHCASFFVCYFEKTVYLYLKSISCSLQPSLEASSQGSKRIIGMNIQAHLVQRIQVSRIQFA